MLEVRQIDVFYGNVQALHGVSLRIDAGELVGIVGANGSGKTTLIKSIVGLLHPSSGEILFLGENLNRKAPHQIAKKGVVCVPEGRGLFSTMTVFENLVLGSYLRHARKERENSVEWIFKIFPVLKERRNQVAGTLSGGEQQMLAIGRGLMSMPKILILDEPSLGLAPLMVQKIFEVINIINERNISILLVEQNTNQTLRYADRAYVLENGKVVLEGTGDNLANNEHVRKAYLGL